MTTSAILHIRSIALVFFHPLFTHHSSFCQCYDCYFGEHSEAERDADVAQAARDEEVLGLVGAVGV